MMPFPPIVIQNGGKNAVWESRETERWHRVKNLLHWWHLTAFLTTATDPSHSLRMTPDAFLIMTPYRLRHYDAFRSPLLVTCFPKIVIQNGGKNALWESRETGQWNGVKNLLCWWRLTDSLITVADPSHSSRMTINVSLLTTIANPLLLFRITPNGNHMLRLLTHS